MHAMCDLGFNGDKAYKVLWRSRRHEAPTRDRIELRPEPRPPPAVAAPPPATGVRGAGGAFTFTS